MKRLASRVVMVIPPAGISPDVEYPGTGSRFIGLKLSLFPVLFWDKHPKWRPISMKSIEDCWPNYSATARCRSTNCRNGWLCRAMPAGAASSGWRKTA
ncbi:hypothetical protein MESS2_1050020 [Mesorhizobium metallidurans STM 2683]|uniref:Uncharacterized protein n=1 Tax=Mesorhizobium metallidurans STM 2683 TaxID=1297569 RepID=M5EUQ2_9HYPH|nr:hypothetical protein MESS2_1050020 [Mesorhizobium metallidurans STM 2683]